MFTPVETFLTWLNEEELESRSHCAPDDTIEESSKYPSRDISTKTPLKVAFE